jgi:hypothetical protein
MISLSVYGQPPNYCYATIWVQRSGPPYRAIHDASITESYSFFDTNIKDEYVSTTIATEQASSSMFSCVMEKNGVTK